MKFIKLDPVSQFVLFCLLLSQLLLSNGFYMFACVAVFGVLFFYIQRPHKPGIFTFILIQHILQIIAGVWLANYMGEDINFRSRETATATMASLAGVIVLFLPILYFQNRLPKVSLNDLKGYADKFSTDKIFNCYVISFFGAAMLGGIAFVIPGLAQVIISFLNVKWVFLLLFGFQSLLKNEKRKVFYICVCVEILLGFFSFFSDFKLVIYFLTVLVLSFVSKINAKQIFIGIFLAFLLATFGIYWTSIKADYRAFLNQGKKQQTVEVSRQDALNKLLELSSEVDNNTIEESTQSFLERIQYTYHFAKAIERVPDVIPYQNGNNWLEVLAFTTTPRFLNPDKPKVDNSRKASLYTGIQYANAKKGVSFSLGYFAECYVDFGLLGMMFPLLMLGLLYGNLYNYFMRDASKNLLFNYAVVGAFFMEFYGFEMDATYLVGRLFSNILTFVLLIKFFFPAVIQYITISKKREIATTLKFA